MLGKSLLGVLGGGNQFGNVARDIPGILKNIFDVVTVVSMFLDTR